MSILWCAKCEAAHDPDLHFDRWQFDNCGDRPGSAASELQSIHDFNHELPIVDMDISPDIVFE